MPFTDEEMKRILKACDTAPTKEQAVKLRAMVLLMRHSGLRIGDACRVARARIHGGILTLRTEKGGTTVRLPLHPDALAALAAVPEKGMYYFWNGESKPRTIVNYWQDVFLNMFKRAAMLTPCVRSSTANVCRSWWLCPLMENVSTLLGHRDLKITQRTYAAFTPKRRDALEQAVRAAVTLTFSCSVTY